MNPNGCLPIAVFSVSSPQTNFHLLSNGLLVYSSCRHDPCQGTSAWQQQRIMTEPWEVTLDPFPYAIPTPLHRESHDFWEVSVLDQVFCMERNWQEVIHMKGIYLKLNFFLPIEYFRFLIQWCLIVSWIPKFSRPSPCFLQGHWQLLLFTSRSCPQL